MEDSNKSEIQAFERNQIEATEEKQREEAEEKRRKKKIIFYKAKENLATDVESKKNDDEQLERNFLSSIDMAEKEIVSTVRLGRKIGETTNRPLLVTFNNEQDVVELSQNVLKMKDATTEIGSFRISPDRTLKEKEKVRKMVNKEKKLERSGKRENHASGPRDADKKVKSENRKVRKTDILVHER